jgi:hypothetical protein
MASECMRGCVSASLAGEGDGGGVFESGGMWTVTRSFSLKSAAPDARRPPSQKLVRPTHPLKSGPRPSAGCDAG